MARVLQSINTYYLQEPVFISTKRFQRGLCGTRFISMSKGFVLTLKRQQINFGSTR